ncbi:MAG: GNAT family N-acetyltransferase [Bacteroidales bacterium]|nr:GNAT family N-acetyltransferase [Bacteroidales bacterium]
MSREFGIIPARIEDAPLIARAVMMAVGEDICRDFAGDDHSVEDVEALFTELAAMDDSQYSYRNTLVALDPEGKVAGVCVAYDGALLHRLRRRFFEAAKRRLNRDMEGMADETSPDEFYLDTLAVWEPYRGNGLGRRLLLAQAARAHAAGKPAGLLVDKDNPKAEALYRHLGFTPAGERPFAGVVMNHLQLTKPVDQQQS